MLTLLNVLLVGALLMLVLLVAACASISIHSTEDSEPNAVSMYRQDFPLTKPSRAIRASPTYLGARGVRQRANKKGFCRNHGVATGRK